MHYRANDLSGGQQQRVAIARALVAPAAARARRRADGQPRHRVVDEVFALMRRFNRELGTTFLVVTHDPRIAERCNRIIEIVDGRVRSDQATPRRP